ncbi:chemotaxis protein CheA [Patescibacteria group bacterium]|nr:chemotaxis protein CheA [Patescibacteria group bacterium]
MKDDLMQYIGLFETEAREYLQDLNMELVKAEKNPDDAGVLYNLMRISHNVKGMCATMGLNKMTELCHEMESYFDAARKGEIKLVKEVNDLIFKGIDALENGVKMVVASEPEPETAELSSKLNKFLKDKKANSQGDLSAQNILEEKMGEKETASIEKIKDIKVSVKRLDKLMNLMEEMIILRMRLGDMVKNKKYDNLSYAARDFEKLSDELQYNVMQSRMVEVGYLFNRFPRMVRDLAGEGNKEIELIIEGGDIELDRSIIDELGEPLVHLIRNAIDHGLDKKGTIKMVAKRERNNIVIEISDDGKGIDVESVKRIAVQKGLFGEDVVGKMNDNEIMELIFDPMLSTKQHVTDVSGRGVGMSAVKKKIEELNGEIIIESKKGEGTTFKLVLPLTMAIISSLLVRVSDELFAIPANYVNKSHKFANDQIKKVADERVAIWGDNDVALLDLAKYFDIEKNDKERDKNGVLTVIAEQAGNIMGLVVDEVVREEEIIVKPLSLMIRGSKAFAGVATLGDGKVVLILDVPNLI